MSRIETSPAQVDAPGPAGIGSSRKHKELRRLAPRKTPTNRNAASVAALAMSSAHRPWVWVIGAMITVSRRHWDATEHGYEEASHGVLRLDDDPQDTSRCFG
jgi:hypothetical protein